MRKAILKSGVAAFAVASAVTLAAPAAHATGTYPKYVTTFWGGIAEDQCNTRGKADERNVGAVFYTCTGTERVGHGGVTQPGYILTDYFWIT